MKVCMVSPYFYPDGGGLGHHIYYVVPNLVRSNCEVEILTTRGLTDKPVGEIGTNIERSLRLFTVFNSPIAPGLLRKIPRVDADIIHAHGYFHLTTLLASVSFVCQNRPLVITTHGSWASNPRREFLQILYDKSAAKLFSRCQKILVHTFAEKQKLENAGLPGKKLEIIYNGVDTEKFNPETEGEIFRSRLNINSSTSLILFVGRLRERKGCGVLIRALARAAKKVPKTTLLVAGVGPDLRRLHELAAEYNISQKVFFLGKVDHIELPLVYAAADIVALPSISGEGLPLTVLEAMASQKPIVATKVGGIPEIFNMTNCGVLVNPNDAEGLAGAIVQLLANKERMKALAQNGRRWSERKFRWEIISQQIYDTYREALNN